MVLGGCLGTMRYLDLVYGLASDNIEMRSA